jgi:hypothetical protein
MFIANKNKLNPIKQKGEREMKFFKVFAVLVAVALVVPALFVGQAQAAWGTAVINAAGNGWANQYIQLTDSTGTNPAVTGWWQLDPAQANQLLATSLTALSNAMLVNVYYEGNVVFTVYALK